MMVWYLCPVCLELERGEEGSTVKCGFCGAETKPTTVSTKVVGSPLSCGVLDTYIKEIKSGDQYNAKLDESRCAAHAVRAEKLREEFLAEQTAREIEANTVRCPICRSTNISTGARGWKWTTGFIGSGKTVNRCANCGHTWEPRKR